MLFLQTLGLQISQSTSYSSTFGLNWAVVYIPGALGRVRKAWKAFWKTFSKPDVSKEFEGLRRCPRRLPSTVRAVGPYGGQTEEGVFSNIMARIEVFINDPCYVSLRIAHLSCFVLFAGCKFHLSWAILWLNAVFNHRKVQICLTQEPQFR